MGEKHVDMMTRSGVDSKVFLKVMEVGARHIATFAAFQVEALSFVESQLPHARDGRSAHQDTAGPYRVKETRDQRGAHPATAA